MILFSKGHWRSYQTFIIHGWERRMPLKIQHGAPRSLPDTDKDEMDVSVCVSVYLFAWIEGDGDE